MNKSQRLRILLAKGYFPEELPPPFVSDTLAKYRTSIIKKWSKLNDSKPYKFEIYSYPRMGRQRRRLAVVNPISQTLLSAEIANNWIQIRDFLSQSKISLDVPLLERDAVRAIPKPNFTLIDLKKLNVGSEFSHIVQSDISRFYGTIYTHALPWALHGKNWSKTNLYSPSFNACLGNKLDKLTRKGQDNQTLGIPIGPDTSRILSEIIAIGVENEFLQSTSLEKKRMFRYVDDWFVGFDAGGEAEDAIALLSKACSVYELELNHQKTKIIEPTDPLSDLWPAELRDHKISSNVVAQASDIQHFFSRAFHFAKDSPDKNVLVFALKRARSFKLHPKNVPLFESYVLRAARANPTVFPVAAQILINLRNLKFPISNEKVRKLIHYTIRTASPVGHYGELSWALFLAKGLSIPVGREEIDLVTSVESSVCALITLDLRRLNLVDQNIDTSLWESYMNDEGLHSPMWLLSYEADLKGWLPSPNNHVKLHNYFSVLKSKGIYFYDTNKNVPTFNQSARNMRTEKKRQTSSSVFLSLLQQFETSYN